MSYHGYDIDEKWFNSSGDVCWYTSGNGAYVTARKEGKRFFLKRSLAIHYPDSSLPSAAYNKTMAHFKQARDKQNEIAERLKDTNLERERLVREIDHFADEKNYFVTVTPLLDDGVSIADAHLDALSPNNFLALALSTAQDLAILHRCHVIHGDIKPENFIYRSNASSYDAFLLDFDISYPDDQIMSDDTIGGTAGYMAPELIAYQHGEGEVPSSVITPAIDVFSLAIVWHSLWTGSLPEHEGHGDVGDALNADKSFTLARKFDIKLPKGSKTLADLMRAMLAKEAKDRPSAETVRAILEGSQELGGVPAPVFLPKLYPGDEARAELLSAAELRAKGVLGFRQEGTASAPVYVVTTASGEAKLNLVSLLSQGYAKEKKTVVGLEEPWPQDGIVFESPEVLAKKQVAKIRRSDSESRGFFYILYFLSGGQFSVNAADLCKNGYAHKKDVVAIEGLTLDEAPWPEDGSAYAPERIARLGYITFHKTLINGEHGYEGGKKDGKTVAFPSRNARAMMFFKK